MEVPATTIYIESIPVTTDQNPVTNPVKTLDVEINWRAEILPSDVGAGAGA